MFGLIFSILIFCFLTDELASANDSPEESTPGPCDQYIGQMKFILYDMFERKAMPDCWEDKWEKIYHKKEDLIKRMEIEELKRFVDCFADVWTKVEKKLVGPSQECIDYIEGNYTT